MSSGMAVTFDYSEVISWAADLDRLWDKWLPLALQGAVLEAALFFEREAKMEAPVDSGRLMASIGHGPDGVWEDGGKKGQGYWIDVGTNVEYAPYMEFGFTMASGHVAYIKAVGGFRYVHPFVFEGYHYMQKAANKTDRMLGDTIGKHMDLAIAKGGW